MFEWGQGYANQMEFVYFSQGLGAGQSQTVILNSGTQDLYTSGLSYLISVGSDYYEYTNP